MSSSSDKTSIDLTLSCSSDAKSSASEPDGSASNAVVELYMYKPLASDSEAGGVDDSSPVEDESEVDVFSIQTGKDLELLLKLWMIF